MRAVSLERTSSQLRRWRRYLAAERAEGAVYRDLASRRTGEEREILLALADAERRHEQHWLDLLGDDVGKPARVDLSSRMLGWAARRFGSVFVLALAQRAESRSPYETDADATASMAADERVHEEVVRGLAARGRNQISGTFRAAVFGANDGLVSNLALVLGVGATGVSNRFVLVTGIAGLLAGALSMGAGEYISVSSQRELLDASDPKPQQRTSVAALDVDANELALVYRARGMNAEDAEAHARSVLRGAETSGSEARAAGTGDVVGTGMRAALASFMFFASGAIVPVVPYLFGMSGWLAIIVSAALVGVALIATGGIVGILSGASPMRRAVRQLAIGFGAAAVTVVLGYLVGPLL
ncbi:MAG: VIT1/CCC1 transporter family protein [Cryobacterium sp.]|nr:VIT1/CCC1 transporter family protein [Cryobacterium sp.]